MDGWWSGVFPVEESGAELMEMKMVGTDRGSSIEEVEPVPEWFCSALMHH